MGTDHFRSYKMIDIHTHILPGLDDGPEGWEEAIEMCRLAEADGIECLVVTPHMMDGVYDNRREDVMEKVRGLRQMIDGLVNLKVLYGADVHLVTDLVERIEKDDILTINDKGYLLLELPHHILPPSIDNLIFDLRLKGITPILTHVERSYWIQDGFHRVERFVDMGTLIQITAMSITGGFGGSVKSLSERLLRSRLVHIIASDCHSRRFRPPGLSSAFKVASKLIGEKDAYKIVRDIPLKVIEGIPVC